MNISEQFTIRECMRPSFEGSVNMDLQEDVDGDDYLRKEVSCSKTTGEVGNEEKMSSFSFPSRFALIFHAFAVTANFEV